MRHFTLLRSLLAVMLVSFSGMLFAETFVQIKTLEDFTTGKYVIANDSKSAIMSNNDNKNYLVSVVADLTSGVYETTADTVIFDVTVAENGDVTIANGAEFVSYLGSKNNANMSAKCSPDSSTFTATVENGVFTLTCKGEKISTRALQYNESSPRFAFYTGSQKNLTLFKATAVSPDFVAAPAASVAAGDCYAPISVELTCATEGAKIYYTVDGSAPDATKTEYTAAIAINKTTTVKAIAINGENKSEVTELVYNFPTVEEVADIAAFLKKADKENAVKITGALTVVASDDYKNHYVVDAAGSSLLVYGEVEETLAAGKTITGIVGKYDKFNNTEEIVPVLMGAVADGTPATPVETAIADITVEKINDFIVLKGVKAAADGELTADGKGNFEVYTGTDTVLVYNKFKNVAVAVTKDTEYDVVAVVGEYKGTPQLYPISVTKAGETPAAVDKVEMNADIYSVNGQIVIETEEIGAVVEVYSLLGHRIVSETIVSNTTVLNVERGVVIVKIGSAARKVVVK